MQIKTILENEDGAFEFSADLTPEQHAFLIEFAVKTLFHQGLLQMDGKIHLDKAETPETAH